MLELDVVEYCLLGNEGDSGEQRIELASYGGDGTVRFYCRVFFHNKFENATRLRPPSADTYYIASLSDQHHH